MNNVEETPDQSGPKDGMPENYWSNREKPPISTNEDPLKTIEKDPADIRGIGNASTKTKGEAVQSIEEKIKAIRESKEGNLDKLGKEETPTQKWTERHPSKKALSDPDKINELTETNATEPIEPTPSNTETPSINDSTNLNKIQEPQKAGEETPTNSKLQEFIEGAKKIVKDYVVPAAKTGGGIVTGAKILLEPSDTVDEAKEQQILKDWEEKDRSENNATLPSEESVKEDNASNFDEVSNEDFKTALQDTAFTSTDKNDISDLGNISREDFSNALADLNSSGNEFADDFGNAEKESEDSKEEVLMAMNDFDNSPDKDEIGSFYWEGEVYEEKLERGEDDDSIDMGMDGGDD